MGKEPNSVRIREVGPRDGFQNEPEVIPTEEKVRLIGKLGDTGLKRIELTSFVRPDVIPQLADGEEELVLFASSGDLLRFPASTVRPQGRTAGGMAGMKLAPGAVLVGLSAVALTGSDALFEEPVVVTGAGLPPEKGRGPGTVSSVKVTPLSEYPRKGRATGGVRCQRLLSGEALLVLGWAGRGPAWAAAASGDPARALVELDRHRLLCAHREGPYGVAHWNRTVERLLQ